MSKYARVPGVRVESIGSGWAGFSPLSGETLLLNDAGAAVLEMLEQGPADERSIASTLAEDARVTPEAMLDALAGGWDALISAGLLRRTTASAPDVK